MEKAGSPASAFVEIAYRRLLGLRKAVDIETSSTHTGSKKSLLGLQIVSRRALLPISRVRRKN